MQNVRKILIKDKPYLHLFLSIDSLFVSPVSTILISLKRLSKYVSKIYPNFFTSTFGQLSHLALCTPSGCLS